MTESESIRCLSRDNACTVDVVLRQTTSDLIGPYGPSGSSVGGGIDRLVS